MTRIEILVKYLSGNPEILVKALKNILDDNEPDFLTSESEICKSGKDVIKGGFMWDKSPEGHNFWEEVCNFI